MKRVGPRARWRSAVVGTAGLLVVGCVLAAGCAGSAGAGSDPLSDVASSSGAGLSASQAASDPAANRTTSAAIDDPDPTDPDPTAPGTTAPGAIAPGAIAECAADPAAESTPCPTPDDTNTTKETSMKVTSDGIDGGVIGEVYGKRGTVVDGVPVVSFPITIQDAPAGTVAYAIEFIDPDSVPVCGYIWRHWMATDIPALPLPEDASRTEAGRLVQGVNDYGTVGFGGPMPPDQTHTYVLTVYALSAPLGLADGFDLSIDDFQAALAPLTLAQATVTGTYAS